ncbi:unnamed protein product [Sphenostylis stenocarpa]|uniref:Uncharacterized protein n=1 Tax=Sphenostylis stenocarpa TaxID=92480 RepID=A0AA86SGI4_9FABA|nr:unnamed protein product [Sphenostylis stenocarpa]
MAGREVREYTNLSDPKDKKWGKGKDKIDDEDITFQRMVAKMQEVAGERGGYLHGRGALDSDDLLYLKEQMEAEEDAERLLRRTEKRAFAAFKISFCCGRFQFTGSLACSRLAFNVFSLDWTVQAASLADSTPASVPLAFRVEPKPKSGIRQQDLLKKVVEIKPKRPRSDGNQSSPASGNTPVTTLKPDHEPSKVKQSLPGPKKVEEQSLSGSKKAEEHAPLGSHETEAKPKVENSGGGLLGLAYDSSDDDDDDDAV